MIRFIQKSVAAVALKMFPLLQWFECFRSKVNAENICSTNDMDEKTAKSVLMVERVIMEIHRRLDNNNDGEPKRAEMKLLKRLLQDKLISAQILKQSYGSDDWSEFAGELDRLYPRKYNINNKPSQSLYGLITTLRNKMAHRNSGAHTISVAFVIAFPGIINLFASLLALAIEENDLLVKAKEIQKIGSLCKISCFSNFSSDISDDKRGEIVNFLQHLMSS